MRKAILVAAATIIAGAVGFKPAPAAAFVWVPLVMKPRRTRTSKP